MDKGVFDRFRSLPIARIAPLAGPMLADLVRYAIATSITLTVGMVMGYRPGGGVPGVVSLEWFSPSSQAGLSPGSSFGLAPEPRAPAPYKECP